MQFACALCVSRARKNMLITGNPNIKSGYSVKIQQVTLFQVP